MSEEGSEKRVVFKHYRRHADPLGELVDRITLMDVLAKEVDGGFLVSDVIFNEMHEALECLKRTCFKKGLLPGHGNWTRAIRESCDLPLGHYRRGETVWHPDEHGGRTEVYIYDGDRLVDHYSTDCSVRDSFCYRRGRQVAWGKQKERERQGNGQ